MTFKLCCSSGMKNELDGDNMQSPPVIKNDSSKNLLDISMLSTSSKVGKSMLIRLLKQTHFIVPKKTFSNDKYTFVENRSVIRRRISSKKGDSELQSTNEVNEINLDKEKQLFTEYVNTHDVDGIGTYLKSRLQQWEQYSLDIAVTGETGAGKSSFINAIRGVKPNIRLAAKAGVIETTKKPKDYQHPLHRKLTFWDLPGMMNIFKIDQDIRNAKNDSAPPFDEHAKLAKIRADCFAQLPQNSRPQKIYLCSSRQQDLHRWDMDDFMHDLCQACPQLKRESFVFLINAHCREALRLKVEYLRRRQWFVCSAIAAAAILPVPVFSQNINLIAFLTEAKEYRQQLGLCNKVVERLMELKVTSPEYIQQTIDSILPVLDDQTFEEVFRNFLFNRYAAIAHCVPVVGSVLAVQTVSETLDYFLNLMKKVALMLIDMHLIDIPLSPSSPTPTTKHSDIEVIS
ncbi:unnamed protein product [Rotaria sp. Silwood1]|nr:unnamed protein product [Rotaria sp. Silwood1]